MSKTDCAVNVFISASMHLNVIDEFIAITQSKLNGGASDFTHDSLTDLLTGLTEQREAYRAALAAAPTVNALAA